MSAVLKYDSADLQTPLALVCNECLLLKINMKRILVLVLCISFGCANKQKELEHLICRDSVQYWNYEWPRKRAEYYGFTFSFDKNGELIKYSYSKVKNKRWKFWDIQDPNSHWRSFATSAYLPNWCSFIPLALVCNECLHQLALVYP